jgi:hypothetical protein
MTLHFLPPTLDAYDAAVDDAIGTCNGDLRGALKALIIANEFLERDLEKTLAQECSRNRNNLLPAGQQPSIKKEDRNIV